MEFAITATACAYRAVAACDLLLRNTSVGVQEMQCACRQNGLFALFPYADKLNGAQRRRYTNIVELIGNVDRFLLIRIGAQRFFATSYDLPTAKRM